MKTGYVLAGLGVLGVGAWWLTRTPAAPPPVVLSNDQCAMLVAFLPNDITVGAIAALQKALTSPSNAAFRAPSNPYTVDGSNPAAIAFAGKVVADYLASKNYPGVAACVRKNPNLLDDLRPNCDATTRAIPMVTAAKIQALDLTSAEQVAQALLSVNEVAAAACARANPASVAWLMASSSSGVSASTMSPTATGLGGATMKKSTSYMPGGSMTTTTIGTPPSGTP
jgi:hypothetical protein